MNFEKLNITTSKEGGDTTVRLGEAQPLDEVTGFTITGTIEAPLEFISKKEVYDNVEHNHVTYDVSEGYILLTIAEKVPNQCITIKGCIWDDSDLNKLAINTTKRYSAKELANVLKLYRSLFADRSENMKLVTALKHFQATVVKDLEDADDDRGNKMKMMEQRVEMSIPLKFTLETPIIKGGAITKFEVDICADARDAGVSFWLESVELRELYRYWSKDLIDEQLKGLEKRGYPIIQIG